MVFDHASKTGSAEVTIDATSVNTGRAALNEQIQAADFFDTANHPVITFKSTRMKLDGDQSSLSGYLTIKGVTLPVTLAVTNFQCMPDPTYKVDACGANATVTVKRSDFNMGKYAFLVSNDITLNLAHQGIQGAAGHAIGEPRSRPVKGLKWRFAGRNAILQPHQLELLAPARDADIGIEAVNHGADAVYIGGPSFGARASASNESRRHRPIGRRTRTATTRACSSPSTPSCATTNWSLRASRSLQLYDAGVDALIIQDMGLLELDLPPIQLHASTQTDIRTPEKARFLQDVGLSQIVLARELDLERDRRHPRRHAIPRLTLEFFVHGALCVAYSGQCYISHAHTGRSANRGDCSQACRLPYQVTDMEGRIVAHDKHVLSMKDNNQSDNLEALIDAGIRSFKIEGRYKDMGYVKNITAHYRTLLDALIERRPEFARALHRPHHVRLHPRPQPELQPRIHRLLRRRSPRRHRRVRHAEESRPVHRLRQQGRRQVGRVIGLRAKAQPAGRQCSLRPRLSLDTEGGAKFFPVHHSLNPTGGFSRFSRSFILFLSRGKVATTRFDVPRYVSQIRADVAARTGSPSSSRPNAKYAYKATVIENTTLVIKNACACFGALVHFANMTVTNRP